MKILFCSSEVVPFAKTGGLADVAGALPVALKELKHDIRVVMPKYASIDKNKFSLKKVNKYLFTSKISDKVTVYFIDHDSFFKHDGLYGDKKGDYPDNLERFSYFSKKAIELIKEVKFVPDVVHCNDWQTALIIVYLKTLYKKDPVYSKIKTVFTIHNLAYQGLFGKESFSKLGLDEKYFHVDYLEYYDKINFLKGGLVFSDIITTVSEAYSKEIQTKEFGCGLEGLLAKRKDALFGIINGLDYNLWNPAQDALIYKKYSGKSLKDKHENKIKLQAECGFTKNKDILTCGMVSRLAEQKGVDVLSDSLDELMKLNLQVVILGTGDVKYHDILLDLAQKHKDSLRVFLKFDNKIAHRIYAASDLFLMPSRYEPCGLGQMISLKYATIPLVFKTGGLADTIIDFHKDKANGNGFVFENFSKYDFISTVKRAMDVFKKDKFKVLINRAVKSNFSWQASAVKYIDLFKRLLKEKV